MHILLIIEGTYPWYRGGVSEWIFQYLNHLSDYQFTIVQIATDEFRHLDPSEALYPLTSNLKDFIRIPPPDLLNEGEHEGFSWMQQQLNCLDDLLTPFDLIHVTNTGFAGWLGAELSKRTETRMVLTEHAIYWKEIEMGAIALECGYKIPEQRIAKEKVIRAFKDYADLTYRASDQIISVSRSNIPFQQALGAIDIKYIPNGIPAEDLIKENSSQKKHQRPVIGWVGRCAEMKDPLRFFSFAEAFEGLKIDPIFKMLLSDANEKELERQVREEASVHPYVECIWNQDARGYFQEFDFLMISSHNESQPLVMLEALAQMALPVGNQVGDLTDEFGLVFPKGTEDRKMAEAVMELWNDQDGFVEYLEERHNRVAGHHTWEKIFSQYKSIMVKETQYFEA